MRMQQHESDLRSVEVVDDLSVNRWLMRIMRLGQGGRFSGSSGYGQHALGINNPSLKSSRRKSCLS